MRHLGFISTRSASIGRHLQILMRPAEHQMQLNYISSIGSYTKRNGTEISVNQALGQIQSKHSVSFSTAPYTCNGIQLHLVLSRTHRDLQAAADVCRPGGHQPLLCFQGFCRFQNAAYLFAKQQLFYLRAQFSQLYLSSRGGRFTCRYIKATPPRDTHPHDYYINTI